MKRAEKLKRKVKNRRRRERRSQKHKESMLEFFKGIFDPARAFPSEFVMMSKEKGESNESKSSSNED